jgi:hypothetical protein
MQARISASGAGVDVDVDAGDVVDEAALGFV